MGRAMHPDDVKAADWDFLLSDRFPSVPRISWAEEWGPGDDGGWIERELGSGARNEVLKARANLINAWPDAMNGETIETWVYNLEAAFERAMKPPAVSNDLRGDLENQVSRQRKKRGTTEYEVVQTLGGESYVIDTGRPIDERDVREARERHDVSVREARERFGALDIQTRAVARDGQVGIELRHWDERRWSVVGTRPVVMTLTEAELWLDYWEKAGHTTSSGPPAPKFQTIRDR